MNVKSSLPAIVLAVILLILFVIDWTGCDRIEKNTSVIESFQIENQVNGHNNLKSSVDWKTQHLVHF